MRVAALYDIHANPVALRAVLAELEQEPVIDQGQRDFLASFQEPVVVEVDGLGATLFCHGSPRSDEEILTALTPEERWRPMFAGVEQAPRRRLARRRRLPAQLVAGARLPLQIAESLERQAEGV